MTTGPAAGVVGCFAVAADHPSLPGHFPGRPIVPGVVLLDHVLELVLGPGRRATALAGVKFTAAVCPGETIEVSAAQHRAGPDSGRIGFVALRAGQPVLRGAVAFEPADPGRSAP